MNPTKRKENPRVKARHESSVLRDGFPELPGAIFATMIPQQAKISRGPLLETLDCPSSEDFLTVF